MTWAFLVGSVPGDGPAAVDPADITEALVLDDARFAFPATC